MYKLIALFALFAVASAQILGGGLGLGGGWGWGGRGIGIGGGLGGRVGGLGGLGGGIGGGRGLGGGLGGLGGLDGGWGWAYPAYKYSYGVTDKHTGDNKQASEVRNGAHTETQYSQNIVHG
ncbi:unnamed protein product [Orchesella dallaii]|uniref:Uncharacterized protein n=1 Tax=Orchesella dallaii TaxID=48710 RepID=A0ABP1RZC9_9HEXA